MIFLKQFRDLPGVTIEPCDAFLYLADTHLSVNIIWKQCKPAISFVCRQYTWSICGHSSPKCNLCQALTTVLTAKLSLVAVGDEDINCGRNI